MILRVIFITTAAVVALLAYLVHTDLPATMEDRYRAMVMIGVYHAVYVRPFHLSSWLGYGSFLQNLPAIARLPEQDPSLPPRTAALGFLEVTRSVIAGVPVIMYRPKDVAKDELLPGLIYFHGGGWCMHHPDFHDFSSHDMANCTRKVMISVDYRLAVEAPFPASLQDCLDVTKHVLKNGASLGIDVNRLGIIGDSAGGNLAAAVTLALSKEDNSSLPAIKYQILAFPATQAMDLRTPSFVENGERIRFPSSHRMAGYWAAYLGLGFSKLDEYAANLKYNRHVPRQLLENSKYSKYLDRQNLPEKFRKPRPEVMNGYYTEPEDAGVPSSYDKELYRKIENTLVNPLFSPLMAPDLSGLPPSLVVVAEFDVLRDDGLLYAHRLRAAGVKTDVYISKGFHSDFFRAYNEFLHSRTGVKSMQAMCSFMAKEE